VSALASALIIWYGGGMVLRSLLTLGALVAFLQYAQRFFRPISDMSEKFNVLQGAMASSERIFQLLDTEVEIVSGSGMRDAGSERHGSRIPDPRSRLGRIAFENVTFAYVPGEPVKASATKNGCDRKRSILRARWTVCLSSSESSSIPRIAMMSWSSL